MIAKVRRAILILLLGLSFPSAGSEILGDAVITDGDTLRIEKIRIRLFGIDAPEGKQSCERDGVSWLCGQEAGKFLRSLVAGQQVTCAEKTRDRYGRSVATCSLPDGRDVGSEMVRAGMALAYRRYGGQSYNAEEAEAKANMRGLWGGTFTAPWEWRSQN